MKETFPRQRAPRRRAIPAAMAVLLPVLCLPAVSCGLAWAQSGSDNPAGGVASPLDPERSAVYLDTMLGFPITHQVGYLRYVGRMVMMDGQPYAHSLMSAVIDNSQPITQYSAVTFALNGQFDRFRTTIGRDDVEQAYGPAYCYFEVWGDGQRLYRSKAMRSSMTEVFSDSPRPKANKPEDLDIPIRGVQSLRLIVRYALNITQEARYVNRAYGCVWGNARVLNTPRSGEAVYNEPGSESPLHATLRRAALRLAEDWRTSSTAAPPPHSAVLPPRIGVTPLRLDFNLSTAPVRHGETPDDMRQIVTQTLDGLHHAGNLVFHAIGAPDAAALATNLGPFSPARSSVAATANAARRAHTDLVVFGSVLQHGQAWVVRLEMVDARKGKSVGHIEMPVMSDSAVKDVAMP